jgi:hypothetical protein
METASLIHHLTANVPPVHRLPPPWMRVVVWLAIAIPYIAVVVTLMSLRPDISTQLANPRFRVEQAAAFVTAILAALAAFSSTVPGRSRTVCLLPIAPLAVWLASVGTSTVQDWLALGAEGLRLRIGWDCMRAAVLTGIVPAIAMVAMLVRGAPLFPRTTLAIGALALGALANVGLQLFHAEDISIMVLVWHLGIVALMSTLAAGAGPLVLRWPDLRPRVAAVRCRVRN